MAERSNFLIGYGERLASDMAAPLGGAPKKHPYTFTEARRRLAPKVKDTAKALDELPDEVCPRDQAVALVTLHPTYLAKSYYPAELLHTYGLETIGSRAREVTPVSTGWPLIFSGRQPRARGDAEEVDEEEGAGACGNV